MVEVLKLFLLELLMEFLELGTDVMLILVSLALMELLTMEPRGLEMISSSSSSDRQALAT